MAHFAEINSEKTVLRVICIRDEDCSYADFPASEPIGQAYISSIGIQGEWLQTSYNANFRGVYAGINYTFDPSLGEYGEFVPPTSVAE